MMTQTKYEVHTPTYKDQTEFFELLNLPVPSNHSHFWNLEESKFDGCVERTLLNVDQATQKFKKMYPEKLQLNSETKIAMNDPKEALKIFDELVEPTTKGFNPEKLTFDGREIKSGDEVGIYGYNKLYKVVSFHGFLSIKFVPFTVDQPKESNDQITRVYLQIKALNITKHIPAKSELEKGEEALNYAIDDLELDSHITSEHLDRYYQARKRLEELTNK